MFSDSSEDSISVTAPGDVDNLPTEGRMTIEANEKLILEHYELFVHQQDAEAVRRQLAARLFGTRSATPGMPFESCDVP